MSGNHEQLTDRPSQSEEDAIIEAREMAILQENEARWEAVIAAEKIEQAYRHAAFLDEYAA